MKVRQIARDACLHFVENGMVKGIIFFVISMLLTVFAFVLDYRAVKYGRSHLCFQYDIKYGLRLTNVNGFYISDPWEGASYIYPDTYYILGNGDSIEVHELFGYKVEKESVIFHIQNEEANNTYLKFNDAQSVENHTPEVISAIKEREHWVNVSNPPFLFYYSELIVLITIIVSVITFFLGIRMILWGSRKQS